MSKYGELIKKARKQESQKPIKPADQRVNEQQAQDLLAQAVNLSIKVSAAHRRHWAAEAKRQGTTLTSVITAALNARFGEPT